MPVNFYQRVSSANYSVSTSRRNLVVNNRDQSKCRDIGLALAADAACTHPPAVSLDDMKR